MSDELEKRIRKIEDRQSYIFERLGEIAESIFLLRNGDVSKLKQTVERLQREIDSCNGRKEVKYDD